MKRIAIIGGGIAGFSTALRLQNRDFRTIVLKAHGQLGRCAVLISNKIVAAKIKK